MNLTWPSIPVIGDNVKSITNKLLAWFAVVRINNQFFMDKLQNSVFSLAGNGILENSYIDPLLTAGTGLHIVIKAHTLVSGLVTYLNDYTLAVPASGTYYVWEHQYNNNTFPAYAITADLTNPALPNNLTVLLCSIVTNTTDVVSITPLFDIISKITSDIPPGTINYIPKKETFALSWDADLDTRTGGSLHAVTLSKTPIGAYGVNIHVGNFMWLETAQWSRATKVITFTSGNYPTGTEIVTAEYFIDPDEV